MEFACIFDLDGVLVDTAKYHYAAWKKLAADLGFELTESQNERLKGVSRVDSLELILDNMLEITRAGGGERVSKQLGKLQVDQLKKLRQATAGQSQDASPHRVARSGFPRTGPYYAGERQSGLGRSSDRVQGYV